MKCMEDKYKKLTREDIEKAISELGWDENAFIIELTPEEIAEKRAILGNFTIDGLGERIFRLPGGGLTGIGGVKLINEQFKKHFKEYLNKAIKDGKITRMGIHLQQLQ